MRKIDFVVDELFRQKKICNLALRVGDRDKIIIDLYRSQQSTVDQNTLFDMASVSKIIATTTLCYIAIDKGVVSVSDKVSKYYKCPDDKKNLTIENLLTHTMGIGHKDLTAEGNTYDNIAEYILNIPSDIPIGSDVLYSCPGFILLGKILEKAFGERLDILFERYVTKPLGMNSTSFLPKHIDNMVNSNKEEAMKGIVNDYNCQFLGGVAGNAGVFSNIADLTKYVQMLQRKGEPLFDEKIFNIGIQNHTIGMSESRGYGFVYADKKYQCTGRLFNNGEIGHGGWTGQDVFVDPKTGLYVILLTDATKTSGRDRELIGNIFTAIKETIC